MNRITFERVTVLSSWIFIFCQIWLLILHVYYNKVSAQRQPTTTLRGHYVLLMSVCPSVQTFVKLFSGTINANDLKLGRVVWYDVSYVLSDFQTCRTPTSCCCRRGICGPLTHFFYCSTDFIDHVPGGVSMSSQTYAFKLT